MEEPNRDLMTAYVGGAYDKLAHLGTTTGERLLIERVLEEMQDELVGDLY
jgi:hypothetical protein